MRAILTASAAAFAGAATILCIWLALASLGPVSPCQSNSHCKNHGAKINARLATDMPWAR